MEPTAEGRGVMWTQQEHDRAVDLWRAGVSVTRIAHVMGRTRGSVANRLRRAGVLGRRTALSGKPSLKVKVTQAEKFTTLINSTPGVVSDRLLKANGVSSPYAAAFYSGVKVVRVSGLGYRRAE